MNEAEQTQSARSSSIDDVIAVYKQGVDRTLLRENLRLTPDERLRSLVELQRFAEELSRAGSEVGRE